MFYIPKYAEFDFLQEIKSDKLNDLLRINFMGSFM